MNNMTPQKFQRVHKSMIVKDVSGFNERLLKAMNTAGEDKSPTFSRSVTRNAALINRVATMDSIEGENSIG